MPSSVEMTSTPIGRYPSATANTSSSGEYRSCRTTRMSVIFMVPILTLVYAGRSIGRSAISVVRPVVADRRGRVQELRQELVEEACVRGLGGVGGDVDR